jgi:hypothetical protein
LKIKPIKKPEPKNNKIFGILYFLAKKEKTKIKIAKLINQ